MKLPGTLLKRMTNRYLLTGMIALVWMLFLDRYNIFSQFKMESEVSKLEEDIKYYSVEIEKVNEERQVFKENRVEVEKFAREHYLMKKDNEDLFVIAQEKDK